jgi:hypothetical protein
VFKFNGKKIFLILVTILVLGGIFLAIVFFKKSKTRLNINPNIENYNKAPETESTFLYFTKRDFSWIQRLKKDKSPIEFDLFTCPSAYKQDGKIVTKTYDTLFVDDTFPLYLSEIKNKPYRLKLEGYSQSKGNDKIVIMFKDIETGKNGECAVGDTCATLKLRVIEFDIQGYEKDGAYSEFPIVTISDDIIKKEIILTNEQKFLDDEYLIIIKDFNGNEYIFYNIGDNVQIGEATCVLHSFNKKEGVAKLSLKDAKGNEFNKVAHLIR